MRKKTRGKKWGGIIQLPEVPGCEGSAGAGFKVSFESRGFGMVREGDVGHQVPGAVLGGVFRFATVVFRQSKLDILGDAGVILAGGRLTSEDIYEFHGAIELSKITMKRTERFVPYAYAPPSLKLRRIKKLRGIEKKRQEKNRFVLRC